MNEAGKTDTLTHYRAEAAAARHDAWLDLVDFVESHGGALSGEKRDELHRLSLRIAR